MYRHSFDFLASEPTSEEIAAFRPTHETDPRLRQILDHAREGELSDTELQELDEYERIAHFIVMLKSGHLNRLMGQK